MGRQASETGITVWAPLPLLGMGRTGSQGLRLTLGPSSCASQLLLLSRVGLDQEASWEYFLVLFYLPLPLLPGLGVSSSLCVLGAGWLSSVRNGASRFPAGSNSVPGPPGFPPPFPLLPAPSPSSLRPLPYSPTPASIAGPEGPSTIIPPAPGSLRNAPRGRSPPRAGSTGDVRRLRGALRAPLARGAMA